MRMRELLGLGTYAVSPDSLHQGNVYKRDSDAGSGW
jgi:hypothetical protein